MQQTLKPTCMVAYACQRKMPSNDCTFMDLFILFLIFFYFLNSYSIYKIVKQLTVSIAFCISGIVLQRDHTSKPGGNLGDPLQQAVDNLGMESFVSHMSLGVLLFSPWPPFGCILHSGSFFHYRAFFKVTLGFAVNTFPLTALVCATYFLSCDHVIHCNI